MNLEVLGAGKTLSTLVALVGLLLGVGAHVHQHLVACVEAPILAQAALPAAVVEAPQTDHGVLLRDVAGQIFQLEEYAENWTKNKSFDKIWRDSMMQHKNTRVVRCC